MQRCTEGQIPPKCKETSNLMWSSLTWFILFSFVFWNLFWMIANLRIKYVKETKNVSVLFKKNLKLSFSTFDSKVSLQSWLLWPTVGCEEVCRVVLSGWSMEQGRWRGKGQGGKEEFAPLELEAKTCSIKNFNVSYCTPCPPGFRDLPLPLWDPGLLFVRCSFRSSIWFAILCESSKIKSCLTKPTKG